jgi:PST family polysaccharide transporter
LYSSLSQGGQFLLHLGTTAIIARLLKPSDFGLVAMVLSIARFADQFRDLGLAQATIQERDLQPTQVSAVFWINTAVGFLLTLIVAAAAPAISAFYNEPRLLAVGMALSGGFLLSGLNVQHQALLQRQMLFGRLAAADLSATALSSAIGTAGAFAGWGCWSLVTMSLSFYLFRTLALRAACPWTPGPPRRAAGVRKMIHLGLGISGFNMLNYFSRNLDQVLIGRLFGTAPLGIYSRAYQLLLFPLTQLRTPIMNVGMPALASLRQDPERYRRYYARIVFLLAAASMPAVAVLMVGAGDIVTILLGTQWRGVDSLFRIMGWAALGQPAITAMRGLPLLSLGRGRHYFQFGVVSAALTVAGFVVGVRWGVNGIAWSYVISFYATAILTVRWCLRGSPLRLSDALAPLQWPMLAALVCGIAAWGARSATERWMQTGHAAPTLEEAVIRLSIAAIAAGAAGAVLWKLSPDTYQLKRGGWRTWLQAARPNVGAGGPIA